MYTRTQLLFKYLQYLFLASSRRGHGIHSPFVFDFVDNLLQESGDHHSRYQQVEEYRKQLLACHDYISIDDLGAGSAYGNNKYRKVSSIARSAVKSAKYARLLNRMVSYYGIDSVIELGTSLGVTTRYLALAQPAYGVTTIEGSRSLADLVTRNFKNATLNNVNVICGDFNHHLDEVLPMAKGRKMIFFDGNHQYRPTLDYFIAASKVAGNDDVYVFDDIHWSQGMERAWNAIKEHEKVMCTIDLFFLGIVFFKKEFRQKQHFMIRF